jgi:integrase
MGSIHKLNDRFCRTAKPGRYSDGAGLYLVVTGANGRSWLFRWKVNDGGKTKTKLLGLGSFRDVPLSMARELARQARLDRVQGHDPRVARATRKAGAISFGEAADKLIASVEGGWRSDKHTAQWKYSLQTAAAALRHIPVNRITSEDIVRVLAPIWLTMPESAARLRGRIEKVLDFAKVRGHRVGENPARWRGLLEHLLPKQPPRRQRVRHFPALPYAELPEFMEQLRGLDAIGPRALEFAILTAARSGEVLGAMWDEFDLYRAIWAVPAARMKAGQEHRVPLSGAAIALLRPLAELRFSPYVFPGIKRGKSMSVMALSDVLRKMGRAGITTHGFRSTFRQWCAEKTNFTREVCEAALAHVNPDATEAAYQRSDLLERRVRLMEAWASFCSKPSSAGAVVPIRA